jgi:hypothetical protein
VPGPIKGLAYIQEHRCTVFLIIYGLEDGVSYTVALRDCGVGCTKTNLMVGYPVADREIRINSAEFEFFQ